MPSRRSRTKAPATDTSRSYGSADCRAYGEAFDNLPIKLLVFDENNRLLIANPRFAVSFGHETTEELKGKKLEDLIAIKEELELFADVDTAMTDLMKRIEALAAGENFKETLLLEDGRSMRFSVTKHANGHWNVILADVTSEMETQKRVAEAENRWNFALEASGQGVWDGNLETRETFYSHMWRALRSVAPDEDVRTAIGSRSERVHPDDLGRLNAFISKIHSGEIVEEGIEYREKHRDGHWMWILSRCRPVTWDSEGKPSRIIGIDMDITITKELELKAAENVRHLNTMMENFPGGICMYDENLTLMTANSRYYEVTGLPEEWFPIGSSFRDICRYHAERGEYSGGDYEQVIKERVQDYFTFTPKTFHHKRAEDGATLEIRRTPLEGRGYVVSVEDVTALLRASEERAQLERDLSQAQKLDSLGTLASGVAHEINTPIQYVGDNLRFISEGIRDTLQLLMMCRKAIREPIDPGLLAERANQVAEHEKAVDLQFILEELPLALEQSVEGIQHVSRIVRAIKEFSHPGQTEKAEADINNLIDTTIIVSRNQWKYVAELETDFAENLPPVVCHSGDISQVILNFLSNAAHAVEVQKPERGVIKVSTRLAGDNVVIEISDNGCGIPKEHLERIYDPFFTTKDIGEGTGQGLSIAFSTVVKKHQGTLDCRSVPGQGTTFIISLPLKNTRATNEGEAA